MPLPSQVHVNAALTNFSVRYSPGKFIANRLLPTIPVVKLSDAYFVYGKENMRSENVGPLGPRTPARQRDHSITNATYTLDRYSLMDLVTQEEMDNADPALDPKQDSVATLMDAMYVAKEVAAAALLFSTSNITNNTTLSGTSQWSDRTSGVSNPINAIETAKESVHGSMRVPDEEMTVVMGIAAWRQVRQHPLVTEAFKYTAGGGVTTAQFAQLVGIKPENLLIGAAGYVSSVEGQSTETFANIWGKHCLVAYIAPTVGLRTRTLGVTFQKNDMLRVIEWRENNPEGDNVRVEWYYDQKLIDATAGYFIENAVA